MNPFLSRMRGHKPLTGTQTPVAGCTNPGQVSTSSPGPAPSGEPTTVVSSTGPGLETPSLTSIFERPEGVADCPMLGCDEWFAHPGPHLPVVTV